LIMLSRYIAGEKENLFLSFVMSPKRRASYTPEAEKIRAKRRALPPPPIPESAPGLILPAEILMHLFTFIPFEQKAWLHTMMVCKLWKSVGSAVFSPSVRNNRPIRWAASNGHLWLVQHLMRDDRVDPSAKGSAAFLSAIENGHAAVALELLTDARVDPSVNENYAIRWASRTNQYGLVEELLKDPRVNPCAKDNYALRWACRNGAAEVVQLLLKDPRVVVLSECLSLAAYHEHEDIVRELHKYKYKWQMELPDEERPLPVQFTLEAYAGQPRPPVDSHGNVLPPSMLSRAQDSSLRFLSLFSHHKTM